MISQRKTLFAVGITLVCGGLLVWQAVTKAPTADEPSHLVAGISTVQSGDSAFYRVNPPLHKIISGIAVNLLWRPKFNAYPASSMASGFRKEFDLSDQVLVQYKDSIAGWFITGRLVRVPFVLLAGWLLMMSMPVRLEAAGFIAGALFLLSPLTLGHGWTITPDSFAACASILLLWSTLHWLEERDWHSTTLVGIAWGIALGTKFTFCPLYLLWPIGLIAFQAIATQISIREVFQLVSAHFMHGLVAWAIVVAMYNFDSIGVPLGQHGFLSHRFASAVATEGVQANSLTRLVAKIPSPLPKQFLVGVDEQQMDLERGYPTYVLGTWYQDGIWWYYLQGILVKESLLFMAGVAMFTLFAATFALRTFLIQLGHPRSQSITSDSCCAQELALVVFGAGTVLLLLSLHEKMALNVRYLSPAMPLIYLIIGISVASIARHVKPRFRKLILLAAAAIWIIEAVVVGPHWYAYANPTFGGSYRCPPALHDTNFSRGQDLWVLQHWLTSNPPTPGVQRYVILSSALPADALPQNLLSCQLPSQKLISQIAEERSSASIVGNLAKDKVQSRSVELVISRELGIASPWSKTVGFSGPRGPFHDAVFELVKTPPDEFLTPTIGIWRRQ